MYCTDSLIENLCKTNSSMSLSQLSLRGCELLTDNCIQYVSGKYIIIQGISLCINSKNNKSAEAFGIP
jgi:hypothetical protein